MSKADYCQNEACQILKPHEHIRGGVYFDWGAEHKRLVAETLTLRTEVDRLREENTSLRKVLKWYSLTKHYNRWNNNTSEIQSDYGKRAERALKACERFDQQTPNDCQTKPDDET